MQSENMLVSRVYADAILDEFFLEILSLFLYSINPAFDIFLLFLGQKVTWKGQENELAIVV